MQRTTWFIGPRLTAAPGYIGPTPGVDSMGDLLGKIAARLDQQREREGLIILDGQMSAQVGIDREPAAGPAPARNAGMVSAARFGWQHGRHGPMIKFYRKGRPDIVVGQLPLLQAKRAKDPLWFPFYDVAPAMVAKCQHWQMIAGIPWQAGPAVMGIELMHRHLSSYRIIGQKGARRPDKVCEATPAEATEPPYTPNMWSTKPTGRYLHLYDRRRAGLTAAGVAKLSPAALIRGFREYDPKRAGWWLISVPPWNVPELPHPAGAGVEVWSRRWVSTARMDLMHWAAERGMGDVPQVIDSLTGPARPVLRDWSCHLEGVYAAETYAEGFPYTEAEREAVRAAATESATRAIGMLAHHERKSSILRADWHAGINATVAANLWRIAAEVGRQEDRWPVAFDGDGVWYSSDEPDPVKACPAAVNHEGLPLIRLDVDKPGAFRAKATREV